MSIDFKIEESDLIKDLLIVRPSIANDDRGNIWTSFIKSDIEALLPEGLHFNHDKFSYSKKNVLRGIHGDTKSWKFVTCVHGEIQQVVVDLRKNSPTYLKWQSFIINKNDQRLLLLPPYMGNAYYVMSNEAVYHYKLAYEGDYFDVNEQFSMKWDEATIGIEWFSSAPILSERDQ